MRPPRVAAANWLLRHAALPDNYGQISQKRSISAGEMYLTIYVEWTDEHFGLSLTKLTHF